jgi:2-hydroxychromene-2-carboxylate isomerase
MPETGSIKLYFDYKSPFAFLAMQPAFETEVILCRKPA